MTDERKQLIGKVENLFPADSDYTYTAKTGRFLVFQAIVETWRELPLDTLRVYADLCQRCERGEDIEQ